jgi:hypothetical protein
MNIVRSTKDTIDQLTNMDKENSEYQAFIPSNGEFTIDLQEDSLSSNGIKAEKAERAISESQLLRNPFL